LKKSTIMNYENMTKPELVSRLRQNDKVFEDTFGHVAVGVAHVALNGQFLKINKHFCEITGYPEDEIRENTFHNITFPEDISMQNRARKKVLDGERKKYERTHSIILHFRRTFLCRIELGRKF